MQYGASTPAALVERAAAWGQPALALTDRDGLYGAVRFVQACTEAGVAPVLGVDLAVRVPAGRPRRPEAGSGRWSRAGGPVDWSERGLWTGLEGGPGLRPGGGAGEVPGWGERSGRVPPPASRTTSRRSTTPRTPVRGGAVVDARWPRVTVLARGRRLGLEPGVGWARLCRLVTRTHLAGERGEPVTTPELLVDHAAPPGWVPGGGSGRRSGAGPDDLGPSPLVVLLGPDSDVGRAAPGPPTRPGPRGPRPLAGGCCPPTPSPSRSSATAAPRAPPPTSATRPGCSPWPTSRGCGSSSPPPSGTPTPTRRRTVDVLDAARRLVALDVRHLDRVTTAGHLSPTPAMLAVACDIVQASGPGLAGGTARSAGGATAARHDRRPGAGLRPGPAHRPRHRGGPPARADASSAYALTTTRRPSSRSVAAQRSRRPLSRRTDAELHAVAHPARRRARGHRRPRLPDLLPHRRHVVDLIRRGGSGSPPAARAPARSSTTCSGSPASTRCATACSWSGSARRCGSQLPDIDIDVESARRTEIYEAILDRFGGERVTCVSMMDSYRVRHAIRDVGAALGMAPVEVDAMAKAFPHIYARNVRNAIADLPELRAQRPGRPAAAAHLRPRRAARRPAPAHRPAPVRGRPVQHRPARPHPGRGELASASR